VRSKRTFTLQLRTKGDTVLRSPARRTGSYFKLTRQILQGVRGGISRNQFLDQLFSGLETTSKTGGYVVLIEGYPQKENNRIEDLKMSFSTGDSPHRLNALKKRIEANAQSSFLYSVLAHGRHHEFALRSFAGEPLGLGDQAYEDEFYELHGNNEVWLCALALPSRDAGEPERGIFAVYPAEEDGHSTGIPSGAEIEWDSLELLPDIFAVLQNKVRSLQEQVELEQNQLIAELTPSAIAHEMGTNINLILSSIARVSTPLGELMDEVGDDKSELNQVIDELLSIQNRADKALMVASAFTNLQRKAPRMEANISELLSDIEIVLNQRMGRSGISFEYIVDPELTIVSDIRFIEHVLMNVVINAIEAIESETLKQVDHKKELDSHQNRFHIKIYIIKKGAKIRFFVANDGPPIPRSISFRVFELGVTSKPIGTGHGQGLHLCRQIAKHLGGEFGYGKYPDKRFSPEVVFELSVPAIAKHKSDT